MGLIRNIADKIQAFRNKNLYERYAYNHVKSALEDGTPEEIDAEAKKIQEKTGYPYKECLIYVQAEKKKVKRRESLKKLGASLGEIGESARQSTKEHMKIPKEEERGALIYTKPDVTKSKIFPERS